MADNIDKWISFYQSANPLVQQRALATLVKCTDRRLTPILLDAFVRYSHMGFGADIVKAMIRSEDPQLVEPLMKLTAHHDRFIRTESCTVLGRLLDRRATPVLIECLTDPESDVRWQAAFALSFIGDPRTLSAVGDLYSTEEDRNVRLGHYSALGTLKLHDNHVTIEVIQPKALVDALGGRPLYGEIADINLRNLLLAFDPPVIYEDVEYRSALGVALSPAFYKKYSAIDVKRETPVPMLLKLLLTEVRTLDGSADAWQDERFSLVANVRLIEQLDIEAFHSRV